VQVASFRGCFLPVMMVAVVVHGEYLAWGSPHHARGKYIALELCPVAS